MKLISLKKLIEKPITGEWGKDGGNTKVIRTTNFTNEGILNLKNVVARNIEEKKINSKKLIHGDIIIEKSGGSPKQPVGRVVFYNIKNDIFLCNNFTSILRPKQEIVYPKYLHYILFANHKIGVTNKFQNKTTGIINLKLQNYINDLKIPLPPLAEQQRVAGILDEADQLRQLNKQLIAKYEQLSQSLFLDMFGDVRVNSKKWDIVKFEEIISLKRGYDLPHSKRIKGNIPIAASTGVVGYHNEYKVKEGCIITGRSGSIGKVQLINTKCWPLNTSLYGYNNHGNNLVYLKFFVENFNLKRFSHGAGVPTLDRKLVHRELAPHPPIALQTQFAARVQLIEQQKQQAQEALQKSENLFNALLQKAFKGGL